MRHAISPYLLLHIQCVMEELRQDHHNSSSHSEKRCNEIHGHHCHIALINSCLPGLVKTPALVAGAHSLIRLWICLSETMPLSLLLCSFWLCPLIGFYLPFFHPWPVWDGIGKHVYLWGCTIFKTYFFTVKFRGFKLIEDKRLLYLLIVSLANQSSKFRRSLNYFLLLVSI